MYCSYTLVTGWTEGTYCGYQVSRDVKVNADKTMITYMTTGVLLQRLIREKSLNSFTHIVLDEVCEPVSNLSFLLYVILPAFTDLLSLPSAADLLLLLSFNDLLSFLSATDLLSLPSITDLLPLLSVTDLMPLLSVTDLLSILSVTYLLPLLSIADYLPARC